MHTDRCVTPARAGNGLKMATLSSFPSGLWPVLRIEPPPPPPKKFYKGEGQRADVNEFLMYNNPKEGSTILPSRTSDYMLEIKYGDTINPSTFSAKMGKNDITSLFNPQPDKTEKISIPLIDGKNSLSLIFE